MLPALPENALGFPVRAPTSSAFLMEFGSCFSPGPGVDWFFSGKENSLSSVYVCSGSYNKVPNRQKLMSSQFWKLDSQGQGATQLGSR